MVFSSELVGYVFVINGSPFDLDVLCGLQPGEGLLPRSYCGSIIELRRHFSQEAARFYIISHYIIESCGLLGNISQDFTLFLLIGDHLVT